MKLPQEVNGYEKNKHEGDYGIVSYTKEHPNKGSTYASMVTADKYDGSPNRYVVEAETHFRGGRDWDDAYVGDYEIKKAAKDALVTWLKNHPQGVGNQAQPGEPSQAIMQEAPEKVGDYEKRLGKLAWYKGDLSVGAPSTEVTILRPRSHQGRGYAVSVAEFGGGIDEENSMMKNSSSQANAKVARANSEAEAVDKAVEWMKSNPDGLDEEDVNSSGGNRRTMQGGFGFQGSFASTNEAFGDPFGIGNGGDREDEDNQDPFNWFM